MINNDHHNQFNIGYIAIIYSLGLICAFMKVNALI